MFYLETGLLKDPGLSFVFLFVFFETVKLLRNTDVVYFRNPPPPQSFQAIIKLSLSLFCTHIHGWVHGK